MGGCVMLTARESSASVSPPLATALIRRYLTFVLDFLYFDHLFTMAGSGPLSGTNAEHTAKLDARLHALLAAQGCNANTIGRFGELGVHSVQGLETLVDTRKDLRSFLVIGFGLDPLNGDDATKTVVTRGRARRHTPVKSGRGESAQVLQDATFYREVTMRLCRSTRVD